MSQHWHHYPKPTADLGCTLVYFMHPPRSYKSEYFHRIIHPELCLLSLPLPVLSSSCSVSSFSFPECPINRTTQQVALLDWLLLLSSMYLKFFLVIHFSSLLRPFAYSPTNQHRGYIQLLAIMNKTAISISANFCMAKSFQHFWINIKKQNCGIMW